LGRLCQRKNDGLLSIASAKQQGYFPLPVHIENINLPSGKLRKQLFGDNCVPSLLAGILLGVDSGLPPDVQQAFRDTGTSHIIAISGFNIAIQIALLAGIFGRTLGPGRTGARRGQSSPSWQSSLMPSW
jgi:predicted membrane metal-binding protein